MNDLLRVTFLDRLKRLQTLEAALAAQERLLLLELPKFLTQFKDKVTDARRQLEELVPVLTDDPLNRFLEALHMGGDTWKLGKGQKAKDRARELDKKIDDIEVYLRVCKALAESDRPLHINELKPFVHREGWRTNLAVAARHLQVLSDGGLIEAEEKKASAYVPYRLTDKGRELIQAIFASY